MSLQLLRNQLEQQKGQRLQIERSLTSLIRSVKEQKRTLHQHEQAKEIVREVGLKTQQSLQFHISDITSLALEAVFPDPYELQVEFIQRRNKTECDLYFVRDGNRIDPLTASGVGAVDVAAFALRIASWSMAQPHTDNVILLDEPFRFLSEDYQEQASIMLQELSKKLGLQFIIVTHEQVLASYADRIFEVKIRKGISKVTQS
jgi:predicted ABC-type transport system involved in lysophospholipase L1 biosynthesis ATPase subunit